MSDLFEFEKNLSEIEKELKSECEDYYIVNRSFVDIRDMVQVLIQSRDQRIKELESKLKSSPKKETIQVKHTGPAKDKPKKECSREEMNKVKQYVIDTAKKM
tara:strand:- start:1063 stop:1368 length:306 start_codon:yes stop_codon:yes gene_type:complete